jgi:MoxR-like ATPase
MNPVSYSGVFDLNPDFRSRFEEVELDYLPEPLEVELIIKLTGTDKVENYPISRFVRLARETRNDSHLHKISPRDLVRLVDNVRKLKMERAFSLVMSRAEGKDDKIMLRKSIEDIFGHFEFRDTWTPK